MRLKPPCKACGDRAPGCHGVCLYYKAYREKLDAENEAHRADKNAACAASQIAYERVRRVLKAKHRQGGK